MALGDHYFERIKASNDTYMVSPYAVEPKLDIAALGAVDGQLGLFNECRAFEDFCRATNRSRCQQMTFRSRRTSPYSR